MERLKNICSSMAFAATLFVALLLVGASYTCYISPNHTIIAAYWGLGFPVFLFLNLLMLLLWAVFKKKYIFISIAAILLSGGSVWRYAPLNIFPTPVKTTGDTLTVLTYNTHMMEQFKSQMKDDPNRVLSYIRKSNADIICIQEFAYLIESKRALELNTINKVLADYPYREIYSIHHVYRRHVGMAVYSKYPIKSVQNIRANDDYSAICTYEIEVDNRPITVINVHLESNKLTEYDKTLFKETVKDPDKESVVKIGRVLTSKMGHAFKERAKQADQLAEMITHIKTPLIVCGDFNDTPQSYTYRRIRGELNDAVVERGIGPTITYNSKGFWFRIDHILYSPHLHPIKVEKGRTKASDHYPLKATFVW